MQHQLPVFRISRHSRLLSARAGRGARVPRTALALVEVLVVLAIVGLMLALLFPSIQAVREAARRSHCLNNQRQIGLAIQMHVDARKRLPAGWLADGSGRPGWAWGSALLDFVEETGDHLQFRLNQSVDDPALAALRSARLAVFLCPSDSSPESFSVASWVSEISKSLSAKQSRSKSVARPLAHSSAALESTFVSRSNYVGAYGSREIIEPFAGNGVFFRNSQVRLNQITDGLAKTIAVGERSSRFGSSTWVGVFPAAESLPESVLGVAKHSPNSVLASFVDFGSHHPQVSHFSFADSSVRAINDEVDPVVFRALSTRAGAEIVNEDSQSGGNEPPDDSEDDNPGDDDGDDTDDDGSEGDDDQTPGDDVSDDEDQDSDDDHAEEDHAEDDHSNGGHSDDGDDPDSGAP